MDAEITITFIIEDVCTDEESDDEENCFEDFVVERIERDGIAELVGYDDNYEIVKIKRI